MQHCRVACPDPNVLCREAVAVGGCTYAAGLAWGRPVCGGWRMSPELTRPRQLILYGFREPIGCQEAGMAQKITVTLEDDLDGGPADQTVRFGLDGAEYEST